MLLPEATIIRNRALVIVFTCNILLHVIDISSLSNFLQEVDEDAKACISLIQGLTLLVYPLLGWLADVYLTRYTALKCAPLFCAVGTATTAVAGCIMVELWNFDDHPLYLSVLGSGGLILMIVGNGLFEANALQFGMDQLLDSPSEHLSAFIHWYYWGIHFIQTLTFLPCIALTMVEHHSVCQMPHNDYGLDHYIERMSVVEIPVALLGQFLSVCFTFLILKWTRSHLTIQRAGVNPFRKVYQVLKYSWKHKIPERRSAFTYWEEDVPARINVGKEKYGGPFRNEEVEDTKTLFRLLLVILSLFGFQMATDGFATVTYLTRLQQCPSISLFLVVGLNAKFLTQVTIVLGVPLYRLILLPVFRHYIPRMMRKIWLGCVLTFFQLSAYFLISLIVSKHSLITDDHSVILCLLNQSYSINESGVCVPPSTPPFDDVFVWMIVPQVLGGLSYMLVFMTTLEFICAQAPRTMQGMLIGFWYSSGFIKFAGMEFIDSLSLMSNPTIIPVLSMLKVCASFTSVVIYSCVSRRYQYRERDEAVNFQAMIEDQYEREIEEELLHEEQERPLLESSNVCRNYGTTDAFTSY